MVRDFAITDATGRQEMPYSKLSELPDAVQETLPRHAQEIYKEAYNSAWDQYSDPEKRKGDASREETAHKVAWSAVKNKYTKKNDKWVEK
jgi:cation transport regulator